MGKKHELQTAPEQIWSEANQKFLFLLCILAEATLPLLCKTKKKSYKWSSHCSYHRKDVHLLSHTFMLEKKYFSVDLEKINIFL